LWAGFGSSPAQGPILHCLLVFRIGTYLYLSLKLNRPDEKEYHLDAKLAIENELRLLGAILKSNPANLLWQYDSQWSCLPRAIDEVRRALGDGTGL
jgi:hypothetical protein